MTWRVQATVKRIVDGDTFVADLDLGWGMHRTETPGAPCRVRILHYDTPERGDPEYSRAVQELMMALPLGLVVWVTSWKLDSFGRALCDVELKDGANLLDMLPQEWRVE